MKLENNLWPQHGESFGAGDRTTASKEDPTTNSGWTVRVHLTGDQEARVYTRNLSFAVKKQASFSQEDSHPSAVEYFLGALGGDIINGYAYQAKKLEIAIEDLELAITGQLNNPLVFLDVVGAEGRPGFESIKATLYVSAESDKSKLEEAWRSTLKFSPLVNTLKQCLDLSLHMQIM
jgi:hypothetical protein